MALDPSIITNAMANWQTPAAFDPISQIAKIQALKNGFAQAQLQQQQLQSGALDLQEKQRAFQDQQTFRDVLQQTGGDYTKAAPLLAGRISPQMQWQFQQQLNANAKQLADLDKTKLENLKAQNEIVGESLGAIAQAPPEERPALYAQHRADAISKGFATPAALPEQYPGDDWLYVHRFMATPVKDQIEAGIAAKKSAAELPGIEADTAHKVAGQDAAALEAAFTKGGPDAFQAALGALPYARAKVFAGAKTVADIRSAAMTPAERTTAEKTAAELPGVQADTARKVASQDAVALEAAFRQGGPDAFNAALQALPPERAKVFQGAKSVNDIRAAAMTPAERTTALHDAAMERLGFARLNLSQAEYNQKYGDVLNQMSPNNRTIAEKVAVGDFDPAQLGRMPGKEQIIAGAIQIAADKGIDWTPQIYATKKSFTDPEKTQAKNLGTISRIVSHIGQFEQNSKDMGFAPAYAYGVNLTGGQAKLNEDAQAISGELEKLVSGGVGSVEQTRQWQKDLHSPSADARQQAINEISQLVGGQYEGMNQTYKAATGSDLPIQKYVSPAGQNWMRSKGINVQGAAQPAPGGAPPLPSRLSAADVGKTYVNKAGKPIRITAVNPADPTQFKSQELP